MAVIEKRSGKNGINYRVKVRVRGRPTATAPFKRITDAKKWAQITEQIRDGKYLANTSASRRLFLTTVDENIARNAIEDMASFGVYLVIPESLQESKLAEYSGHRNVLSFKELCMEHIQPNLRIWKE